MRIYIIVISITMLFGNANAKITPVTELQSGTVHIISSMLSLDGNKEELRKSRVHQKERQLSGELGSKLSALTDTSINDQLILASNEKILDIPTDRDAKAKNSEYMPIEQPANDQLIDISTERDGGSKKSNSSLGQQPANDQVYDIPSERNASSDKNRKSKTEQPIHGKLIDVPTERDGAGQKKSTNPDDEKQSTESESPPTIIPVEGVH